MGQRAMTMVAHVPEFTKVNKLGSFFLLSKTIDDKVKIYQKCSCFYLLTKVACGIIPGRPFRGQCDNRVLAIATMCVKNSSYPSMLKHP